MSGQYRSDADLTATTEPRKIVQIATMGESSETPVIVVAMCNDGSVWGHCVGISGAAWFSLSAIPQGPVA